MAAAAVMVLSDIQLQIHSHFIVQWNVEEFCSISTTNDCSFAFSSVGFSMTVISLVIKKRKMWKRISLLNIVVAWASRQIGEHSSELRIYSNRSWTIECIVIFLPDVFRSRRNVKWIVQMVKHTIWTDTVTVIWHLKMICVRVVWTCCVLYFSFKVKLMWRNFFPAKYFAIIDQTYEVFAWLLWHEELNLFEILTTLRWTYTLKIR